MARQNKNRPAKSEASLAKDAGPSVAKEDVNVSNPGKKPRAIAPSQAKPRKKAGKRLMDFTG